MHPSRERVCVYRYKPTKHLNADHADLISFFQNWGSEEYFFGLPRRGGGLRSNFGDCKMFEFSKGLRTQYFRDYFISSSYKFPYEVKSSYILTPKPYLFLFLVLMNMK